MTCLSRGIVSSAPVLWSPDLYMSPPSMDMRSQDIVIFSSQQASPDLTSCRIQATPIITSVVVNLNHGRESRTFELQLGLRRVHTK
jgi:hypothetical protein